MNTLGIFRIVLPGKQCAVDDTLLPLHSPLGILFPVCQVLVAAQVQIELVRGANAAEERLSVGLVNRLARVMGNEESHVVFFAPLRPSCAVKLAFVDPKRRQFSCRGSAERHY